MRSLWFCFLALLAGCASASSGVDPSGQGDPGGAAGQAGSAGAAGVVAGAAGAAGAAGSGGGVVIDAGTDPTDCGDVGRVIFVVSNENMLLKFDPKTETFASIGKLNCTGNLLDSPFSMAVDRAGTAFVLYQSGNIYRVSTTDATCEPSGFSPNQLGWERFGMGYVSDAAGSKSETLFIIDGSAIGSTANKGLGKISHEGKVSSVGQFSSGLAGRTAEVTGLGDGRLFAFFVDSESDIYSVAEIDKQSGAVVSNEPQALPTTTAWAFAHWGGSFYLFNGSGGASRVHKYTPGKGTTQIIDNAGYSIVGAGVSTCAPTVDVINLTDRRRLAPCPARAAA